MATLLPDANITREHLKGYRVFLFSHDHPHPAHIHFGKGTRVSAWDLTLQICRDRDGFSSTEIAEQRRLLKTFAEAILRSWNEHWKKHRSKPSP